MCITVFYTLFYVQIMRYDIFCANEPAGVDHTPVG